MWKSIFFGAISSRSITTSEWISWFCVACTRKTEWKRHTTFILKIIYRKFSGSTVLVHHSVQHRVGVTKALLLIHWGQVMHACVNKLTIIGSDNGLLPGRCQAIILINAVILLTGPLGTNFREILIKIHTFSFKKMHLKMSSVKRGQFALAPMCWLSC